MLLSLVVVLGLTTAGLAIYVDHKLSQIPRLGTELGKGLDGNLS